MLTLSRIWGHTPRPWGYEVRADYHDGVRTHNEVLTFAAEPSAEVLTAAVAARQERITTQLAEAEIAANIAEVTGNDV